jgi:hypothetical protein
MNERIKAVKEILWQFFCYFATLALRKSWSFLFIFVSVNYIFQQKFATFL